MFDLAAEFTSSSPSTPSSSPSPIPSPATTPSVELSATKLSEENSIIKKQVEKRKLVFVEAEQMLFVNTDSGWRPIQLLAPIRDFRKTITKFNLNSSEERQKLLLLGQHNDQQKLAMDNSIKPSIIRYPQYNIASGSLRNQVVDGGNLFDIEEGEDSEDVTDDGDGDDEDEDDDDEDGDGDEDEDDRNSIGVGTDKYDNRISGSLGTRNKLKLEENIADEDDDDDEDEHDDEEDVGGKSKFIGTAIEEKNKLLDNQEKNKMKISPNSRTQISGRSLAAALVSASIDNSITVKPSSLVHNRPKGTHEGSGDKRLKVSSLPQISYNLDDIC